MFQQNGAWAKIMGIVCINKFLVSFFLDPPPSHLSLQRQITDLICVKHDKDVFTASR